jgi:RND family efflux transporter MFP subunit
LDVAKADLTKAEAALKKIQAGPDAQAVAAARAKVAAAQAAVDQAHLTAPFHATVVAVSNKVGDSVEAGQSAIVLADLTSLEVEVSVAEVDINRIVIGQAATLTLDAAPGQTFTGKVSEVNVLGQANQGVVTFPVTVVVPEPSPQVKPGMTAAVSIITDSRENVLLVPNRAVRVSGGQRTVTVLFEGEQIPVPVTLGLVNETMSEVLTGLKEGDTVLLNTSTTTQNRGGFGGGGGFLFGGGGGGFRGGG